LFFEGISEYLEDLVAWIDTPILNVIFITFYDQPIFDSQQLSRFIRLAPKFEAFKEAHVSFFDDKFKVELKLKLPSSKLIRFEILCGELGLQLSYLTSSLLPLHTVENLYIFDDEYSPIFADRWGVENTRWLELSHPFTALKNLHLISREFAPLIVPILQALVGERGTEVLPTLQNIFLPELELSGPIEEAIQRFIATRQLSGHPLTVHIGDKSIGCQRDNTD
jgi:hypothetical protein